MNGAERDLLQKKFEFYGKKMEQYDAKYYPRYPSRSTVRRWYREFERSNMTNKAKHTPGPWVAHIQPGYSHYDVVAEVNRGPFVVDIIARLPRFRPQFNGLPGEQIANAKLVAHAPDLWEACRAALDLIPLIEQGMGNAHPERRRCEQLIHDALAGISLEGAKHE